MAEWMVARLVAMLVSKMAVVRAAWWVATTVVPSVATTVDL